MARAISSGQMKEVLALPAHWLSEPRKALIGPLRKRLSPPGATEMPEKVKNREGMMSVPWSRS